MAYITIWISKDIQRQIREARARGEAINLSAACQSGLLDRLGKKEVRDEGQPR